MEKLKQYALGLLSGRLLRFFRIFPVSSILSDGYRSLVSTAGDTDGGGAGLCLIVGGSREGSGDLSGFTGSRRNVQPFPALDGSGPFSGSGEGNGSVGRGSGQGHLSIGVQGY